jgi:hypothetical protein
MGYSAEQNSDREMSHLVSNVIQLGRKWFVGQASGYDQLVRQGASMPLQGFCIVSAAID